MKRNLSSFCKILEIPIYLKKKFSILAFFENYRIFINDCEIKNIYNQKLEFNQLDTFY